MIVIDTSGVVDFLLGVDSADAVAELWRAEDVMAAPDVMTFEMLAVLRRGVLRGVLDETRATAAVIDFGDLAVELWPSLPLRARAWELRDRLTAADALFAALAEHLDARLATKDAGLATTARGLRLDVVPL